MTDFASLDIKIDSSQTKAAANDLDNLTTAGTRAEKSAEQLAVASARVNTATGQQRAGMQQLGYQFGDFTTQVSSGTSVSQAFAQQIGQVSQALGLMGGGRGALGAVAGFLAGPWGIALTVGTIALSGLIGKLFEAGDAADDAKDRFQGAADAARNLIGASNALRLNDKKITLNSLTEEQFALENLTRNSPFANDPNAAIFSSGRNLGGARRRIEEINQQQLKARNEIKLADELNAATERTAQTTTRHTTATTASAAAHRVHTTAVSASQKALNTATKSAQDYIDQLHRETEEIGLTTAELRRLEVARKIAAAPVGLQGAIAEAAALRDIKQGAYDAANAIGGNLVDGINSATSAFAEFIQQGVADEMKRQKKAADDYADSLRDMVGFLDQIGGKTGRTLGDLGAIFTGLSTGNFSGVGGPVGAALGLLSNTPVGTKADGSIERLGDRIEGVFDKNGAFGKTFKSLLEGAGTGAAIGSILFGSSKSAQTGGAIGGALGQAIGGPIGSIVGSLLGSTLGSALKKTKTGTATLGFTNGDLGVVSTGGNSASRGKAASGIGESVTGALASIADRLGGTLDGPISVSIGIRDKNIRVDTTGSGATKKSKGAIDFGQDQAAAIKFAIADAIKDGAISGLSAGVAALLKGGSDIEKQLSKALKFQSVFDDLKQRTDPLGFALEQLSRESDGLRKIFAEAGASAQDYAQLEQLLALKRADAEKDAAGASKALKDFLLDLNAGPGSPLSLRQQRGEAEAALAPYSAAIASAQAARAQADALKASGASTTAIEAAEQAARLASSRIDQEGFQSAANRLLGISRATDASGAGYFSDFDRIRGLTSAGIGLIDKSATADHSAQIVQNTADTANLILDSNTLLKSIDARLASMNDNGGSNPTWFDATRNFG